MKVTKRQLRQIIKEEKARVLAEQSQTTIDYRVQQGIDDMKYAFGEEISAKMNTIAGRDWYKDDNIVEAVEEMLKSLLTNFGIN